MILILFAEQRRLREDEYPLEVRVVLGPHENVTRLFLVDKLSTPEISSDVAQFLNLSLAECHGILQRYHYEEERQILLLKEKYGSSKHDAYLNFCFIYICKLYLFEI